MRQIIVIRNRGDYEAALERIKKLWDAKPGTEGFDELDSLATLVDRYEEKQFPFDPADPVQVIFDRMDDLGLSRKDLESCIGSRPRVSEILNKKRALTLPMIRKLSALLRVPADMLIKEYPLMVSQPSSSCDGKGKMVAG